MIVHWTFDPVLISIGPLIIRWYGLLFVGAFLVSQLILKKIFVWEGIEGGRVDALLIYALVGTIVGARLAHCLFYNPQYYLTNPLAILRVWEGGLASHGGVIGLLAGMWVASKKQPKLPFLWLIDRAAIPAALGASFIRGANFLNSEIVGVPTSGSWGVVFTAVDAIPRHPVQAYEAIAYASSFMILWLMYRQRKSKMPVGCLFGWLMILVFGARLILEEWKTPQAAYENGQLLSVGQLLSIPFIAVGIFALWRSRTLPHAA